MDSLERFEKAPRPRHRQLPTAAFVRFAVLCFGMASIVGCSGSPMPSDAGEGGVVDVGMRDAQSDAVTADTVSSDTVTTDVVDAGADADVDAGIDADVDAGDLDAGEDAADVESGVTDSSASDSGDVDGGVADAGPTTIRGASGLVGSAAVMRSANFRMVSTFGQSTLHQGTQVSARFSLRGGLVGAVGGVR